MRGQAREVAELLWRMSQHTSGKAATKFVSAVGVALADQHRQRGVPSSSSGGREGGGGGGGGEHASFTREHLARLFVAVRDVVLGRVVLCVVPRSPTPLFVEVTEGDRT